MCIFSFLCAIILAVLDKRAEVLTKRKKISLGKEFSEVLSVLN